MSVLFDLSKLVMVRHQCAAALRNGQRCKNMVRFGTVPPVCGLHSVAIFDTYGMSEYADEGGTDE